MVPVSGPTTPMLSTPVLLAASVREQVAQALLEAEVWDSDTCIHPSQTAFATVLRVHVFASASNFAIQHQVFSLHACLPVHPPASLRRSCTLTTCAWTRLAAPALPARKRMRGALPCASGAAR